ncbi:hypothetical protein [Sphingomonas aquatilis]|uniref:hypothetical protein n=1 Tax=Sphingomonas aquatilis TaxID=93063 RepID=UPI0023F8E20C|nr:hypothetical protein [Sphingomonas aquatilis]MCI4653287.1 hypothetical protein [Sphingomonas aquatilis]
MTLDWRQGLTSIVVAAAVAGVVSLVLRGYDGNAHLVSALAIGLGIGASRLVQGGKRP